MPQKHIELFSDQEAENILDMLLSDVEKSNNLAMTLIHARYLCVDLIDLPQWANRAFQEFLNDTVQTFPAKCMNVIYKFSGLRGVNGLLNRNKIVYNRKVESFGMVGSSEDEKRKIEWLKQSDYRFHYYDGSESRYYKTLRGVEYKILDV